MKVDCSGKNKLNNPLCCPSALCDPFCILNPTDPSCDECPPEEKCTWGYLLGDVVTELLIEPIQK